MGKHKITKYEQLNFQFVTLFCKAVNITVKAYYLNRVIVMQDFSVGKRIVLAFQTLGVVFGDVGTSPLYTFDVMFTKAPIKGKEDVIGALSLVLYTLILIPLVKYVFVVLWANDDGEGMLEVVNHILELLMSL